MVFSSPVFLFVFLPACLVLALAAGGADVLLRRFAPQLGQGAHPLQNLALLLVSLAFYLYGSGEQILVLAGSIAAAWVCGLVIGHTRFRRGGLALGVTLQLATLGYYKYANFFVDQASVLSEHFGMPTPEWTAVVLPIGVSFFVFQAISYTIDVHRNERAPLRNPLDVALYIAMFPQLIAGPIVRYKQIADQLHQRRADLTDIAQGGTRFVYGLCKKVVVADAAGQISDAAYALPHDGLTGGAALIGAFAYTFQIYFDFSAYSDMAIGLGRMFGFHFPENFHRPLTAISITDFWRRWHMTLSFWFRDYLYVPLGGSRGSPLRTYFNLWAVFVTSGLWHGANWTFIIWGGYHGLLLTLERVFHVGGATRFAPARRALTYLLVVVGFTIFRADDLDHALAFYRHIFVPTDLSLPLEFAQQLTNKNLLLLAVAASSLLLPPSFTFGRWLGESPLALATVVRVVVMTLGVAAASALIASNNFSPFIYFRF